MVTVVFLLFETDDPYCGLGSLHGAFSTEEKAEKHRDKLVEEYRTKQGWDKEARERQDNYHKKIEEKNKSLPERQRENCYCSYCGYTIEKEEIDEQCRANLPGSI